MEYNFEKFENRHARVDDRISVTRSDSIGFPSKFYDDHNLDEHNYALLFFDKSSNALGVKFVNDGSDKAAFKIIKHQKYGGGVSARSFFKANNIDPRIYYGKYEWKKYSDRKNGELFVIELKVKEPKVESTPPN